MQVGISAKVAEGLRQVVDEWLSSVDSRIVRAKFQRDPRLKDLVELRREMKRLRRRLDPESMQKRRLVGIRGYEKGLERVNLMRKRDRERWLREEAARSYNLPNRISRLEE